MDNLLTILYESNKITDEDIKEFIAWYEEICHCAVCNVKLMHDDEVYSDEVTGDALCDKHSIFNEKTSNYRGLNADETYERCLEIKDQLSELKRVHFASNDRLINELSEELHYLNLYYNKK